MAKQWVIGEKRYAYTAIIGGESLIISSADYTIYDTSDENVVASGVAGINGQVIYCLWQPDEVGIYVVDFDYKIGQETFTSRQIVEVRETL